MGSGFVPTDCYLTALPVSTQAHFQITLALGGLIGCRPRPRELEEVKGLDAPHRIATGVPVPVSVFPGTYTRTKLTMFAYSISYRRMFEAADSSVLMRTMCRFDARRSAEMNLETVRWTWIESAW
jgi:hypothetical protein